MAEPARILNGDVFIAGDEDTVNNIFIGKSTDSVDVPGSLTIAGASPVANPTTGAQTFAFDVTMSDGVNIIVDTTTGTNIGTAVTQKLGFWGVSPVVQPADAAQADQGAITVVGGNSGTSGAGLTLIGDTSSVDQASNLMNDLLALQEDITALDTLLTEVRTALVDTGIMKGAA